MGIGSDDAATLHSPRERKASLQGPSNCTWDKSHGMENSRRIPLKMKTHFTVGRTLLLLGLGLRRQERICQQLFRIRIPFPRQRKIKQLPILTKCQDFSDSHICVRLNNALSYNLLQGSSRVPKAYLWHQR